MPTKYPITRGTAMVSSTEADRIIRGVFSKFVPAIEMVDLARSAGRVLAEDLVAERDQPPFDRVAMDGIALALTGKNEGRIGTVNVVGSLRAGARGVDSLSNMNRVASVNIVREVVGDSATVPAETAPGIEVMTGAALPEPWDTVVPIEDFEEYRWNEGGYATLRPGIEIRPGSHIHYRASDYREGQLLVAKGERVAAPHLHVAASNGYGSLQVYKKPSIAILSTGDELVALDSLPGAQQIRRSNPAAIAAQLALWGYDVALDLHLPDDVRAMEAGITRALETCDIVLMSGGVSMGSHDLVPSVLSGIGCEELFHGVAVKPGKPLFFGIAPGGKAVFGLPGNPVSALVTFRRFVLPFLPLLEGGRELEALYLPLASDVKRFADKTRYSAVLIENEVSRPSALRIGESSGSGNFFSLLPSDGIAEIPPGETTLDAGTEVAFYPWVRGR